MPKELHPDPHRSPTQNPKDSKADIEAAWYAEAARRIAAFQAGQAPTMTLEEAMAEVSQAYKQAR